MVAADPAFVYQPLSDCDGAIEVTFRFLLGVAHKIDFYIEQGLSLGCNNYHQGVIYRRSSEVIAYKNKGIRGLHVSSDIGFSFTSFVHDVLKYTLLPLTQDLRLRERAQVFDVFSEMEFKHHPFHWHKSILLGVEAQLKFHLTEAHHLFKILNAMTDEEVEDQTEQIFFTAEHMMYCLIPLLKNITETIRRLIIVPQNGYYSKTHASNIALAYRKGSPERGRVIKQMVANRCVPSKNALYDVINLRENGLMFVEEKWNTGKGKKGYGLVTSCEYEYSDEFFVGRIMLALISVPCSLLGIERGSRGERPEPEIGMLLGAPPKEMDISNILCEIKDERFYFSPLQFPTPVDLEEAGKCASFQALNAYIEYASEKEGSPVICCGGRPGSKRFVCKHSEECRYSFLVKWDMYGYYIHHYNHASDKFVGDECHNHNRVIANPYVRFECRYCEMKSYKASDMKEHEEICKTNSLRKNDISYRCDHAYCTEQFLTYSEAEAHEENCCRAKH